MTGRCCEVVVEWEAVKLNQRNGFKGESGIVWVYGNLEARC